MLNEDEINVLADIFAERFDNVNRRILEDIGHTIKRIGSLTPSQAKKLQQMYTYGADINKMTEQLAQASGQSIEDIKALYNEVAKEGYNWSKPFYEAKGLKQIPFKENKVLQNLVLSTYRITSKELKNISLTTAVGVNTAGGFKPLGSFYKDTIDNAITAVATGTMDYNSAIKQAVKDLGGSGLRVRYESGYTRRIDSAARQNVLDGISYIAQETAKSNGEEFGADGYEISAHATCAPDHLPYQGKQYTKAQFDKLQSRLKRPIGQWNCRHLIYPIILGVSTPAYSDEELKEFEIKSNEKINIDGKDYTRYECSQIQRKLETKLRYAGEEKAFYKTVGDDDLTRQATEKIRILTNKYIEVSNKAGLPTRLERAKVVVGKKFIDTQDNIDLVNISKGLINAVTGKSKNVVNDFKGSLRGVKDKNVRNLLTKAVEDTEIKTSMKKNSYHSEGKVFLSGTATKSTLAHELFHKIDYDYQISESGYFSSCIKADYQRMQNIAAGYGGKIEDMLYYKYPNAFRIKENGKIAFKVEYRGISDILNGMSEGKIKLGYVHVDAYWKKNFALEKETWAQIGRVLYSEDDNVIEVLKYVCPETYKKAVKKIKELS